MIKYFIGRFLFWSSINAAIYLVTKNLHFVEMFFIGNVIGFSSYPIIKYFHRRWTV